MTGRTSTQEQNSSKVGLSIFHGHPVLWLMAFVGIFWKFLAGILHARRALPAAGQIGPSHADYLLGGTALLLFGCLAVSPGCLRQRLASGALSLSALTGLLYAALTLSPTEAAALRCAGLMADGISLALIATLVPVESFRRRQ